MQLRPNLVLLSIGWLALLVMSSCFVEPIQEQATVRLQLDLTQVGWGELGLALTELPGPRSSDGLIHLDLVPAYVQVTVTGPGIDPPVIAAWPQEGSLSPREQVSLEVELPAGSSRRFDLLAYVYRGGEVRSWTDDGSLVLDLEGGKSSEVDVVLRETGSGTLQCAIWGDEADSIESATAVDGDPIRGAETGPGVAFPPVEVVEATFEVRGVPVRRPVTFRLARSDDSRVYLPSSEVEVEWDGQVVTCEIDL